MPLIFRAMLGFLLLQRWNGNLRNIAIQNLLARRTAQSAGQSCCPNGTKSLGQKRDASLALSFDAVASTQWPVASKPPPQTRRIEALSRIISANSQQTP